MLVSKNREQRGLKAKKSIGIEPMLTRDLIKKGGQFQLLISYRMFISRALQNNDFLVKVIFLRKSSVNTD